MNSNTASGTNSVTSGFSTQATASTAHAEGARTTAAGAGSHSDGYANTAGNINTPITRMQLGKMQPQEMLIHFVGAMEVSHYLAQVQPSNLL